MDEKMNTVSNNKLEIFERQERGLRPTVALLSYVKKNADGNRLNVRKGALERAFGKKRRTINGWIRTLCIEGVIKYKTSGQIFINPEMFFEGTEDDFNKIKSDFSAFRSDIK